MDRVRGEAEHPSAWNMYSYVSNNPLQYVDPDGMLRIRATQTPLGYTFELDFETSPIGIRLKAVEENLPSFLFGRFKRFKSIPDAGKTLDQFIRGPFVETSSSHAEKLATAEVEKDIRDEFFGLLGKTVSSSEFINNFKETSTVFTEAQVRQLDEAVTTVVNRQFRQGKISITEKNRLLVKYNSQRLIKRAIQALKKKEEENKPPPR